MRLASLTLAVFLASGRLALGHEPGTTQIAARFGSDRHFTVAITTDAAALVARLEVERREARTNPESSAALAQALDRLCPDIPRHVAIWFDPPRVTQVEPHALPASVMAACSLDRPDDSPVEPRLANGASADDWLSRGAVIMLSGRTPPDASAFQWRYGLTGSRYALSVVTADGLSGDPVWVEADATTKPLPIRRAAAWGRASTLRSLRTYAGLGFTHILPKGLDHILFVLAVFLLSRRVQSLLWQVSAFTVAHSITLGLTLYGVLDVPASMVEPLIALSIVYVAVENLVTSRLTPWRLAIVFMFGLLHGMGFAGVLRELMPSQAGLLTALIGFNVGIEAGQLAVIACAALVCGAWTRNGRSYHQAAVVPGSLAIAAVGAVWTLQRLT